MPANEKGNLLDEFMVEEVDKHIEGLHQKVNLHFSFKHVQYRGKHKQNQCFQVFYFSMLTPN